MSSIKFFIYINEVVDIKFIRSKLMYLNIYFIPRLLRPNYLFVSSMIIEFRLMVPGASNVEMDKTTRIVGNVLGRIWGRILGGTGKSGEMLGGNSG